MLLVLALAALPAITPSGLAVAPLRRRGITIRLRGGLGLTSPCQPVVCRLAGKPFQLLRNRVAFFAVACLVRRSGQTFPLFSALMSQLFHIHPENPQLRLINEAVKIIQQGGVVVYPTDSCYALGCHLGDKKAMDRIIAIRQLDLRHHFTLACRDLSEIGTYARVDNIQYRLLKATTPGAYTFILQASKEVPRRTLHPKRNTIGLRVPNHPVALALLEALGEPMLSCTLMLPGEDIPPTDPFEIRGQLQHVVDLVIDGGYCGTDPTTVVDLTDTAPVLVREGAGDLAPFGF